jgi:hypothetical protein
MVRPLASIAALLLVLVGALVWSVLAAVPPAARGADAPMAVFSAGRAMADIRTIARAPHLLGSPEDARIRAYLTTRLRALGADVSEQPVPLGEKSLDRLSKWQGHDLQAATGHNVIGLIHGRNRSLPALLLMAHHDSVAGSPGAADDAVGLAAALESARAMLVRGRPARDVILLFTDGEEVGLDGAEAFYGRHKLAKRTGAIVNMEARGGGGRANMFETGPGNAAMMRVYAETVDRPATNSLSVLVYDHMPNYTDYTVAKRRGIPGFNFALLDRGWVYHSPLATPEAIDPRSLQDMGDQVLALASALAFAPALPAKGEGAAFADLMGRVTIAYPAMFGWIPLLVATALIGLAGRRSRPDWVAIGKGAAIVLALLAHGALLLTAVNALSGSGGANYYDRLAALPRLEIQAILGLVAMIALAPLAGREANRLALVGPALALFWLGLLTGGSLIALTVSALLAAGFMMLPRAGGEVRWGGLLLLTGVAWLIQIALPTIAPLFVWPLLLAAIGLVASAFLPPLPALAIAVLLAIFGLGHLSAQAHFVMLAVGAELPSALIAFVFPAVPLLWPLVADGPARKTAALAFAAAVGIALWVRFDAMAPSIATYSLAEGGKKSRD